MYAHAVRDDSRSYSTSSRLFSNISSGRDGMATPMRTLGTTPSPDPLLWPSGSLPSSPALSRAASVSSQHATGLTEELNYVRQAWRSEGDDLRAKLVWAHEK